MSRYGVFSKHEKSLLLLRFLQYLRTFRDPSWLLCFLSLEFCYICYFCDFCDIFVMTVFSSQEKSLLLLRFSRYLRTFWGPSLFLLFLSLEFCYICYFCDFCDICHGCFLLASKILVTFAIFAKFEDISGPFLVSSFFKSRILSYLLFCDFCDI